MRLPVFGWRSGRFLCVVIHPSFWREKILEISVVKVYRELIYTRMVSFYSVNGNHSVVIYTN